MTWIVGLALFAAACGEKAGPPGAGKAPPPREVEVLTLAPSPVRDTGEYLGSLLSRQSVVVLPQVNGYVREIHVKPGQRVQASETLIEIDARQETAALDSARAQAGSAEARLELARTTVTRTEALYGEGLVSAQELDRARADLRAAEAALRAAGAGVAQASVQLQYHAVKAAVPGVVGEVAVRVGAFVNTTTPLTTIAQADVLELGVAIPAARARTLRPDTPVEIVDEAGNVILRSTIFYVAPEADPRTQLVEVKAVFENRAGLRPSELVRARLVYSTREALQVPALSVVRQSGQPFVFTVIEKDGRTIVERRPVTLGALGEESYVVESGVAPGTRIAVSSLQMLRDGAAIVPKPAAPAGGPPSSPAPASSSDAARPSLAPAKHGASAPPSGG
jgi:RND family efflux transporter MFP subunit